MKVGEIIGSVVDTVIKIAIFVFLATCIYKGALMAYDYGYRVFTEAPISVGEGRIISVEIKEDMSAMDIGEMLQQKGLIREARIFYLQEMLSEFHGDEVPGIYDLSTTMTAEEMLAVLSADVTLDEEMSTMSADTVLPVEMGSDSDSSNYFEEVQFDEEGNLIENPVQNVEE